MSAEPRMVSVQAEPHPQDHEAPQLQPWHFLAYTIGLSWLIWIPALLSGAGVDDPSGPLLYLGGLGPAAAGLVLLYRTESPGFIEDFWRRMVDGRRIGGSWWAFILLFPAVVSLIALAVYLAAGKPLPPLEAATALRAAPWTLLPLMLYVLIFGPLPEELGWRGYGLDALQQRTDNALLASLILGATWAVWHLPLFFIEGTWHSGLGFGPAGFWWFALSIVAQTLIITLVYNANHRSILAAIVFHFSVNLTGELLPLPEEARSVQLGIWIGSAAIITILWGAKTLSPLPPEDGLIDELRGVQEPGVCPWRAAGALMSPLRRLILPPEKLVERLGLRGDERLLELGPGPGYFSPALAEALPDGHLVLLDLQHEMLAMVRGRLEQADATNTACVQGSAVELPFADGSFDAVVLVAVLGETPDPAECLAEVKRVLRPGGLYSNTEQPGDPDFTPQPILRSMAEDAGFAFEEAWGAGSNYTMAFRKQ